MENRLGTYIRAWTRNNRHSMENIMQIGKCIYGSNLDLVRERQTYLHTVRRQNVERSVPNARPKTDTLLRTVN